MAPLPDYVAGTITLTNGSANFTGTGTGWLAAGFREGDTILGIEDNPGVTYVVESVTDNDSGTLTQPWDGPTGTYTYRMRCLSDGQRVTAQARQLIELLGNGNLQAVAGLPGTPNTFMMFTGAGSIVEVPRTDLVSGANYDVQVDTLADRAAYDGSDEGFTVLVANTGDGRAAIYSKLSNAVGDWSDPAYVTGPAVTLDVGSVTPVAFGNDPDVTLNPVAGGYEFDFELPENATFQSGTITTLNPGEDATFSLSPVAGGYALNLGVPRGPTGDINGVTPFWQGRITVDEDATAARAGLGADDASNLLTGVFAGWGDGNLPSVANPDGYTGSGAFNVSGSALMPDNGNWNVFQTQRAATRKAQIAQQSHTGADNLIATRSWDGTVWTAWQPLFNRLNVVGTVSQTGGTPTGAVIERGSNGNGDYIRYADGTQICTYLGVPLTCTDSTGAIFRSPSPGTWDFPATWAPGTTPSISASVSNAARMAAGVAAGTVSATIYHYQSVSSGSSIDTSLIAIGRWY